jgi:carbonic anhydrase
MKLNSLFFILIFSIISLEKGYTQEKKIFLGFEGGAGPMHWRGAGPMHWKELSDILAIDIYLCREGTHQSPININNALGQSRSKILTDFSPTPIRIINNGHTIHLSYDPGSYINWGNKRFELIQFHFHSPSEHLIKGKHYDMEMHLVYKTHDHQFLVIGVLMEKGKNNALIQKIWEKIPVDKNKEVYYEDYLFNVGNLLPS